MAYQQNQRIRDLYNSSSSFGTAARRKMLESAGHVLRIRQTWDEVLLEKLLREPHRFEQKMKTIITMEKSAIGCSGS
jgi:hypothetical protein